ncbi:MAG TPA: amino acid adenylation domain-containing protein [Candidatus Sulfotelmatobacter sp.]|jgi:amino acid adenylation domain-containing protein
MSTNLALPFCNNARNSPDRLALSVNQREFTYGELAELVERIAAWLQSRSSGEVKLVGILASRSWPAYAGLLGTCWAGAAYVPLNPDWPEQRLLNILQTTNLDALVVDDRGLKLLTSEVLQHAPKSILAPASSESFSLLTPPTTVAGFDALPAPDLGHLAKSMTADDLAYVMFTSGTTGSPKGVMVSTGNVASFLAAMRYVDPEFSAADRVSQTYDLTFDPSVMDMFMTWSAGASLHVVPAGQLMGPSRFIRDHQLTCWFSVPSTIAFMRNLKMLTPGAFPSIRYSIFCGEPLPASAAELWQIAAPNSAIDNLYGPTEATVVCIGQRCTNPMTVTEGRGTVATGKPFTGMSAAIVDASLNFLAPGEKGELALCGPQVAKGYFKDPQKTAARFPVIDRRTWYLTGDLASQDSAGIFHHLGRIDNQVKVLGNRVEIEDVEAHLREACGVDSVSAIAWPITNGSAGGIVAFVAGSSVAAAEIRERMQRSVPKYMVPSEIRFVPHLPVSAAGKTDRKTLTAMLAEGAK